jgi:hypothetical protein
MSTNETEINLDRNWSFDVNLSGLTVQAAAPKDVPKGFYKATVDDMYVNVDKNAGRVIIKLMISEGEFKGAVRTDGISMPKDENDKVRYYWRALAESAGYTPAQLDNGGIKMNPSTFKGREVHIHYIPRNEAAGVQYDKIEYLTPADFATRKANGASASSSPVLGGTKSDTVSKGDVFAKLGIS